MNSTNEQLSTTPAIDGNNMLAAGIRECLPDKHKRRDNKFGVTWCVKCGQLFTKPSGIPLQESDKVVYACR